MKISEDAQYTNAKGETIVKHRFQNDAGKPLLIKANDCFIFNGERDRSTTCITKDPDFYSKLKAIEHDLTKRFPSVALQPVIQYKEGSKDEYICFPFISQYSAFFNENMELSPELYSTTQGNLEGTAVIRVNGLNVVNDKAYINLSLYQAKVKAVENKPIDFDTFIDTL